MNSAIIGAQWGDEGKGRVVDLLTQGVDVIVRFQGGHNAGHTVIIGEQKYALHVLPSGILSEDKTCVLANGMVLEPHILLSEIQQFVKPENSTQLFISDNAHVIMFYHALFDVLNEKLRTNKIGTTKSGIGPAYADKSSREGITIGMFKNFDQDKDFIREKIRLALRKMQLLYKIDSSEELFPIFKALGRPEFIKFWPSRSIGHFDFGLCEEYYQNFIKEIGHMVCDTSKFLFDQMNLGKSILFEGAQGVMLDVDHGTYPYVTSSNTGIGAIHNGVGVYPHLHQRIGVAKAYCTRVGEGPFRTELDRESCIASHLREKGHEFGTKTGRERRCGWLDIGQLRQVIRQNGFTEIVLTKLDVLSGLSELLIATNQYSQNPEYKKYPGWEVDISDVKAFEDLPENAKIYIKEVEAMLQVPIQMISVGPERSQILYRESDIRIVKY